nr:hypothetical protein [Candidatus Enterousia merdequi]
KRYAGDTFVCMQEWFGVNVTTFKENAYRETRAQTAASSAMLGSGLGTALGTITSGAMGRALDTQKAKKEMDAAKADMDSTSTTPSPESNAGSEGTPATPPASNVTPGGGEATPDTRTDAEKLRDDVESKDVATLQQEKFSKDMQQIRADGMKTEPQKALEARTQATYDAATGGPRTLTPPTSVGIGKPSSTPMKLNTPPIKFTPSFGGGTSGGGGSTGSTGGTGGGTSGGGGSTGGTGGGTSTGK